MVGPGMKIGPSTKDLAASTLLALIILPDSELVIFQDLKSWGLREVLLKIEKNSVLGAEGVFTKREYK